MIYGIIDMFDGGYATLESDGTPTWHFFATDHLGNVRVVSDVWGRAEQINHYYPYGLTFADAGKGADVQPCKHGGKELDAMYGLYWSDFGARHLSPYLYCANNPFNFIDPDGRKVTASNRAEQRLLLHTLSPKDANFVKFHNGSINQTVINSHNSDSPNFNRLKELTNSEIEISINLSSGFEYKDDNGDIGFRDMPLVEYEEGFSDFSFKNCNGNTTGETGFLGKTLLPGIGGGGQNSIDNNISVHVNQSMSTYGAAETLSHELYGHALIFVRTKDRKKSGHDILNQVENNRYLETLILSSRKETIENLNQWELTR